MKINILSSAEFSILKTLDFGEICLVKHKKSPLPHLHLP